ncbi:hypothetical protein C8J57DRAFT_1298502 [Mycena rebaudengoi]|nr:hypothetical protein C8J57DRAFT_1298502 [Mycena rebaudengoi]
MSTYSAWFVTRRGHPTKALELKEGLPIPTQLAKGNVLVKVLAVALNPAGYGVMGAVPNFMARRPHLAELEMAGIVVDANGTDFNVGDKVFGADPKKGALAEYIQISSQNIDRVPSTSPAMSAVVGLTAHHALVTHIKAEAGQMVFINGGSSSVGLSAIQIAKSLGCKVVATASGKNKDKLLALGVDEFIDYTTAPLVEQLLAKPPSPKFHAIFDCVGLTDPSLYLRSRSYLAPGGVYVNAGTMPKTRKDFTGMLRQFFEGLLRPTWLGGVPHKYVFFTPNFTKAELQALREVAEKGALRPLVDSVHSFDRDGVMKAYERIMSKRAVGKVVIKVAEE